MPSHFYLLCIVLGVWDPYETKTVKLAQSEVPNSGDGVVLIRDVPKNRMVSMYSLYKFWGDEEIIAFNKYCLYNESMSKDYRRHCNKYSLGSVEFQAQVNLPPEFDHEPYPNLGPKVNHHFR